MSLALPYLLQYDRLAVDAKLWSISNFMLQLPTRKNARQGIMSIHALAVAWHILLL